MVKKYLKENWPLLLLLLLAIITRFAFLSYPSEVVFDEVHFGKFVSAYFDHKYYFDIHPPLGKMLIAGFAKMTGFNLGNQDPDQIFSQIGNELDAHDFFILRFLPALFGVILVFLIYKLALAISRSKKAAFLGGFLVLFDTSFLVESRLVLVDAFLLVFGFSALYFFIISREKKDHSKRNISFLIAAAVFSGLAFSIKWTGLSFWGLIILWLCIDFLRKKPYRIKPLLLKLSFFIFIPFFVYLSVFFFHSKTLYRAGPGSAYMSQQFQKSLLGNNVNNDMKPLSFWKQFLELNSAMYRYNKGITSSHPYSSKWYQWPLAKKAIWYWNRDSDGNKASIYLMANPAVWWPVFFAVILSPLLLLFKKFRKRISKKIYILLLGYVVNLLPYIFISRVTFLYHYLPSLIFGIIILSLIAGEFFRTPKTTEIKINKKNPKTKRKGFLTFPSKTKFFLYSGYLFLVLIFFLLLYPLCYGLPLPQDSLGVFKNFL